MKKLVTVLVVVFALLSVSKVQAQTTNYGQAIGVRLSHSPGITYKKFLSDKNALEFIGHARIWNDGSYFAVTGLYQWVLPFPVEQMNWYAGVGADVGLISYSNTSEVGLGIDGIVGIEYTLADYPFNFSLDWIPSFAIINNGGFYGGNVGLSARYVF